MKRVKLNFAALALASFSLWLVAVTPVSPQSQDPGSRTEKAKKEAKVVWYTSMNIAESRPLLDAFEKKHPFIEGELFRASSEKVLNRIQTETWGGRWGFDVVSLSEIGLLAEDHLLSRDSSRQAGTLPPIFKDPDGYWAGVYTDYYVIGYNTALVPEEKAPKDWDDFLDPKWKGKVAIDREEYAWYATLLEAWGEEKAQE